MKKHTNLGDEIFTMKKPDTSWHFILVGLVIAVTLCFAIFVGVSLVEVAMIV